MLTGSISARDHALGNLISIVIPVYNREDTVIRSLQRIKEVLSSISPNYEIIVVNDGSTDKTLDILQTEQSPDSHLKIVTYPDNRGKGYAVKRGVIESRGDIVVFTDGDLDISPNAISQYIKQLETCDLVIGSKRHPLSKVDMSGSRKFLSRAFNLIVRIATGIKCTDTQSGLKAGDGNSLRAIFKLMLVKRYAFDVELLTIASMLRMNIKEMPIEITLRRSFKVRDIARMFVDVLAISYRLRLKRWYQKQLQMNSAPGVIQ